MTAFNARQNAAMVAVRSNYSDVYRTIQAQADPGRVVDVMLAAADRQILTAAEALQLLVEAIDAQTAKTGSGDRDDGYIRLSWIAHELADARRALEERCESVVR